MSRRRYDYWRTPAPLSERERRMTQEAMSVPCHSGPTKPEWTACELERAGRWEAEMVKRAEDYRKGVVGRADQ